MNEYLFDVLPYLAEEEYWIETELGLAKAPAFLILWSNDSYILFLNKLAEVARYKKIQLARNRIKELVESGNYPMKVYLKKRDGKLQKKPFAVNMVRRVTPLSNDIPVRAFEIREWAALGEAAKQC